MSLSKTHGRRFHCNHQPSRDGTSPMSSPGLRRKLTAHLRLPRRRSSSRRTVDSSPHPLLFRKDLDPDCDGKFHPDTAIDLGLASATVTDFHLYGDLIALSVLAASVSSADQLLHPSPPHHFLLPLVRSTSSPSHDPTALFPPPGPSNNPWPCPLRKNFCQSLLTQRGSL
jgi:hypothetical protein